MSGKSMRNFALGLLVATAIFSSVYFFSPSQAGSTEKLSEADAKSLLEAEGYVVRTQQEWDAQVSAVTAAEAQAEKVATEAAEKQAKAAKETKPKESKAKDSKAKETTEKKKTEAPKQAEQPEKVVKTLTITVAQGMYVSDVANALVEAQLITNSLEFSQRVESLGLSSGLRPGSYEVNSGMTMDEMISVIFKR